MVRVNRTVMATKSTVVPKSGQEGELARGVSPVAAGLRPDGSNPSPDNKPVTVTARVMPQLNTIVSDAQLILACEMRYYAKKARANAGERGLTEDETRIVGGHIRSLAMLAAEERELRKLDDLSRLTDEQLTKLAGMAIKALKAAGENP